AGSIAVAGSLMMFLCAATRFSVACVACLRCTQCVGCIGCLGCTDCIGCIGCVNCSGLRGVVGARDMHVQTGEPVGATAVR
ncbi:MAG: hypothetical protein ACRDTS_18560, partial [Mycobacterium sp.]